MSYYWPGNVRELENCLARAVILCKADRIDMEDLSGKIRPLSNDETRRVDEGFIRELPEQGLKVRDVEQELIQKTLAKCQGNKSLAAELLGISRKALYEKLERYGLRS